MDRDSALFDLIGKLVMCHSPSGVEARIDAFLMQRFSELGIEAALDAAGNFVARIPGSGPGRLAITAHKDEIGASVSGVGDDGRLKLRALGSSFPWVYGEGIVDILGDNETIQGVLSFGSRHITRASPQYPQQETAPVKWSDVWVETKRSRDDIAGAGVRPGSRVLVGRHRKAPYRLGDHIAGYTLDNKASVAILIELARRIRNPVSEICLVFSSMEEVGACGALYFTRNEPVDAIIALEIAPLSDEYDIVDGPDPVIYAQDGYGLYHEGLNGRIAAAASRAGVGLQRSVVHDFGSDASIVMRNGHAPRGACLAFPTQNTHGYEIARLAAIRNCVAVLAELCKEDLSKW
ncbi:MAG: M42 family peptidase [Paracoccus sp. BP8]|nr:MAG: M42 family peptidase [Paracoccus sp. BP8]